MADLELYPHLPVPTQPQPVARDVAGHRQMEVQVSEIDDNDVEWNADAVCPVIEDVDGGYILVGEQCWCGAEDPFLADVPGDGCGGLGVYHCECGGDSLCICHNHGEITCDGCPDCRDDHDLWGDDDEDGE